MREIFPYQQEGAQWMAPMPFALLADEPGVGKTLQAIRACDLAGARRVLVLCPNIARDNWAAEFEEWQLVPRSIGIARRAEDVAAVMTASDVVIVGHGTISGARTPKQLRALRAVWSAIVNDEGHMYANPDARRTRMVYGRDCAGVGGIVEQAGKVWVLTGTPAPTHPGNFYPHFRACAPETTEAVGPDGLPKPMSYDGWLHRFCAMKPGTYAPSIVGAKNVPDLLARLKPYTLRRRAAEVLRNLPPLYFEPYTVMPDELPPMPPGVDEEASYIQAAARAVMSGQHAVEDDLLALARIEASHLSSLRKWVGIAKASAVADLISQDLANGIGKVVVFFIHTTVAAILESRLREAGHNVFLIQGSTHWDSRRRGIEAFQTPGPGGVDVILLQKEIAATAITLTAAHNVVFAEFGWTPSDLIQPAKRCHRIGQRLPVLARLVSLRGSIDESVARVLARRAGMLSAIESGLAAGPSTASIGAA